MEILRQLRLPMEFRFEGSEVEIRREGEAVILEPLKNRTWPKGFFNRIQISDSKFTRPLQGKTPPIPKFG
jgi:virulence-associated protein VagC